MPHRKARDREYQRTFIKEWREYRNLTQEQLAERVEVSNATISRLENARTPYEQGVLEAIADALQCDRADLLARPPHIAKDDLLTLVEGLKPDQREQAKKIIKALVA